MTFKPLRLLVILGAAIFAAEGFIMLLLHLLSPFLGHLSPRALGILDAVLLTVLIFPILHRFAFRPLVLEIQGRKQTEAQLEVSQRRFQSILDAASDAILAIDETQRIVLFNREAEATFGYPADEMIGKPLALLMPARFREVHVTYVKAFSLESTPRRLMGERPLLRCARKNGEEFPAEIAISKLRVEGKWLFTAIVRDVTEREQAEKALRVSEERYRAVFETAKEAIVSADGRGGIISWNKGAEVMFGYSAGEAVGRQVTFIMPERFREAHARGIERAASSGQTRVTGKTIELAGLKKDGGEFPIELSLSSWATQEGAFFTAIIRDITERRQAEKELAHLARFPRENPNPVIEIDSGGSVTYLNPAACAEFQDLLALGARHPILEGVSAALARLPRGGSFVLEVRLDGKIYEEQISMDPEGKRLWIYVSDITERKKAEEEIKKAHRELEETQQELIQAEKLAALGRFSAGVAHEVKNPLGIILGWTEILERRVSKTDADAKEAIRNIKGSVQRADVTVRQLMQFAKPSQLKAERTRPEEAVRETLNLLRYRAKLSHIKIDTQFSEEELWISVDKGQMQQVIFNVLMNAVEAMPRGGEITVKTYSATLPGFSPSRPACVIEVLDTGEGIAKENLARLFEPFFTTRRERKGTGLGLSVSKMIVENHRGKLLIESEPGRWTHVKIALPLA